MKVGQKAQVLRGIVFPNSTSHGTHSCSLRRGPGTRTAERSLRWGNCVSNFGENFRQGNLYAIFACNYAGKPNLKQSSCAAGSSQAPPTCSLGPRAAPRFRLGRLEGMQPISLSVCICRCTLFYRLLWGLSIPTSPGCLSAHSRGRGAECRGAVSGTPSSPSLQMERASTSTSFSSNCIQRRGANVLKSENHPPSFIPCLFK